MPHSVNWRCAIIFHLSNWMREWYITKSATTFQIKCAIDRKRLWWTYIEKKNRAENERLGEISERNFKINWYSNFQHSRIIHKCFTFRIFIVAPTMKNENHVPGCFCFDLSFASSKNLFRWLHTLTYSFSVSNFSSFFFVFNANNLHFVQSKGMHRWLTLLNVLFSSFHATNMALNVNI